jgi:oligopeptide/dipeptide ABC transporter ATP-binding protein
MLLQVESLAKQYSVPRSRLVLRAVNGVSFAIEEGETLALVGESGSGKTTVGRCILRLVEPDAGDIRFSGQDITRMRGRQLRRLRAKMQIVFQEPYDSVNPRMKIDRIIAEPLRNLADMSPREHRARVREVAALVSLDRESLQRYPHELSAGALQRACIARALATDPAFIVLDEPTSLLDLGSRSSIIRLLSTLQDRIGVAYLFISHDLATVRHVSHRVAVMYLGKVVETGATEQIFAKAQHPYTRSLLASILEPTPGAPPPAIRLRGEISSPIDLPTGCSLHPRCPLAIGSCSVVTPELEDIEEEHLVSCIRVAPREGQIVEEGQVVGAGWELPVTNGVAADLRATGGSGEARKP